MYRDTIQQPAGSRVADRPGRSTVVARHGTPALGSTSRLRTWRAREGPRDMRTRAAPIGPPCTAMEK
jgi:hypothetical protein